MRRLWAGAVAAAALAAAGCGAVVLRLSRQSGSKVPPEAFENVKPLHSALVCLVKDGDALRISGFQTIK